MGSGDIFDKLINVEHSAELLVAEAKKEADHQILEAKDKADILFKEAFGKKVIELEKECQKIMSEIDQKTENEIEQYKKVLEKTRIDINTFNKKCDSYITEQ